MAVMDHTSFGKSGIDLANDSDQLPRAQYCVEFWQNQLLGAMIQTTEARNEIGQFGADFCNICIADKRIHSGEMVDDVEWGEAECFYPAAFLLADSFAACAKICESGRQLNIKHVLLVG